MADDSLGSFVMMIVQDIDSLCGVHALNNLMQQGELLDSEEMAAIARELDGMQAGLFVESDTTATAVPGGASGGLVDTARASHNSVSFFKDDQVRNVDDEGNFSLQTLQMVMQRYFGYTLESWSYRNDVPNYDPDINEQGFIVNKDKHWYALRKVHGAWFKLDSLADKPKRIKNLNLFLMQLKQEKNSIFTVEGEDLKLNCSCPWDHDAPPYCLWFSVSDI